MAYDPLYPPTGDNIRSNDYYQKRYHSRTPKSMETKSEFLGQVGPTIDLPPSMSPRAFSVGTPELMSAGAASPSGGGTLSYAWEWILGEALVGTSTTYTPQEVDEGTVLSGYWVVTETGGTSDGVTRALADSGTVVHIAPAAAGNLVDQRGDPGTGVLTYDASADFTGQEITYTISPTVSWVSIDSATGVISIDTDQGDKTSQLFTVNGTNSGGTATSTLNISVEVSPWTPADLFLSGEEGAWYDFSDLSTMFLNDDGTGAVNIGDDIGSVKPKAGHDLNKLLTQGSSSLRPTLQQTGNLPYLYFDANNFVAPTGITGDENSPVSFLVIYRMPIYDGGNHRRWIGNMATGSRYTQYVNPPSVQVSVVAVNLISDITALRDDTNFNYYAISGTTAGDLNGEYNGIAITPVSGTSRSKAADGTTYIGSQDAGAYTVPYKGQMMQLVLLNRVFTAQEYRDIETWAASQKAMYEA